VGAASATLQILEILKSQNPGVFQTREARRDTRFSICVHLRNLWLSKAIEDGVTARP
jgi:hypothetical protein